MGQAALQRRAGLAARCRLSAQILPAFQMLAVRQKVPSGLRQDIFPEELAGSPAHGSHPRAVSGSNGIFFLPSQLVGGETLYIHLVLGVQDGEAYEPLLRKAC